MALANQAGGYGSPTLAQPKGPPGQTVLNSTKGTSTTFDPTSGMTTQPKTNPNGINPAGTKKPLAAMYPPKPTTPAAPTWGDNSGPGILEQWFNQRANGTDPGYEYSLDRGRSAINNEFAARGGYNSGGAVQRIGDFEANMGAQREGQLDSLAGAASGEHYGRLNSLFGNGIGLANGQASTAGGYDTAALNAQQQSYIQQLQLSLTKAGVDNATANQIIQNSIALLKTGASIAGGGGKDIVKSATAGG